MSDFGPLYDAITDEEAFAALPQTVARHIDSRSVVIQAFAADWSLLSLNYCYFTDEMGRFYLDNEFHRHDIWSQALIAQLSSRTQDMDECVGEETFRRSAFCNDFFRHFGDDTGRCVGFGTIIDGRMVTLGAHGPITTEGFDTDQRRRLDALVPHLRRIFAARFALCEQRERAANAEALADAFAAPAMLVDRHARLIQANGAANTLLAAVDGLECGSGAVVATARHGDLLKLAALVAGACGADAARGDALLVERPSGRAALRLIVMPCPALGERALILIDDPLAASPAAAAALAGLYGLTQSEAEVAVLLGEGLTPGMIAELRGVALATVRFQIQQCLRKTDTQRHGELIRLVNRLPGRTH